MLAATSTRCLKVSSTPRLRARRRLAGEVPSLRLAAGFFLHTSEHYVIIGARIDVIAAPIERNGRL